MIQISAEDEARLRALNLSVTRAIEERRAWLDAKVAEYADLKVGDDIYDIESGAKVGVVSAILRFWRDRDDGVRDTSLDFFYEYEVYPNVFDNTSRQPCRRFGTLADCQRHAEMRLEELRARAKRQGKR